MGRKRISIKIFYNKQGVIDYNNGVEIDTLFVNNGNVGFDVSVTNFNIEDLNNDGNDEIILFINKIHDLGQYNDQDESYKKWESEYPHQLIKIYNKVGNSLKDVTSNYFDEKELENYQNWFYPYLSTNISIDLNYDGISDIALYSGKANIRKLNDKDDFHYFIYDSKSNKYSYKSYPGFEKLIEGLEIDTWDIDRVDSDEFDYLDINGDGKYEIVEASVRYNDKNYMLIIEGSVLDSDQDGVLDEYDRCPYTKSGEIVDENGCSQLNKILIHHLVLLFLIMKLERNFYQIYIHLKFKRVNVLVLMKILQMEIVLTALQDTLYGKITT